jgi:hypothetical protein
MVAESEIVAEKKDCCELVVYCTKTGLTTSRTYTNELGYLSNSDRHLHQNQIVMLEPSGSFKRDNICLILTTRTSNTHVRPSDITT